jgi:hypothetical protein
MYFEGGANVVFPALRLKALHKLETYVVKWFVETVWRDFFPDDALAIITFEFVGVESAVPHYRSGPPQTLHLSAGVASWP